MRVAVVLEQRFDRTPDGQVWASTTFDYAFWKAYLTAFDAVRVVARAREVAEVPSGHQLASGPGVSFEPLPYYVGPLQFALGAPRLLSALRRVVAPQDAYVLRLPSAFGSALAVVLAAGRRPYGIEVVGDPDDVFAPGGVEHPLRPLLRVAFRSGLRWAARRATAASYVTETTLQHRYPCPIYMTGISSIRLSREAFVARPRAFMAGKKRLIFVGSLEQLYKGPDILLQAVALLVSRGLDLELRVVGDGRRRAELEGSEAARALDAAGRIRFEGTVPSGQAVRALLDDSDLFVLPSRTEGLPRSLIEAMARGLPAIGTRVGGIPELLEDEALVAPGSVDALASRIEEVLSSPERMIRLGAANLERAMCFSDEVLRPRRTDFYRRLRHATEEALARGLGRRGSPRTGGRGAT
jgi:glycosyltransferase involved in cell wall biosynthesis